MQRPPSDSKACDGVILTLLYADAFHMTPESFLRQLASKAKTPAMHERLNVLLECIPALEQTQDAAAQAQLWEGSSKSDLWQTDLEVTTMDMEVNPPENFTQQMQCMMAKHAAQTAELSVQLLSLQIVMIDSPARCACSSRWHCNPLSGACRSTSVSRLGTVLFRFMPATLWQLHFGLSVAIGISQRLL